MLKRRVSASNPRYYGESLKKVVIANTWGKIFLKINVFNYPSDHVTAALFVFIHPQVIWISF